MFSQFHFPFMYANYDNLGGNQCEVRAHRKRTYPAGNHRKPLDSLVSLSNDD